MKLKNLIGRPVVERIADFVDGNKTSDEPRSGNDSGVGAVLRAARLRMGVQTSEVAQILRIRLPYVEAIENGQYDDLPGLPYEIGFIRAYARHLGLDEDEIVRRYKVENLNKSRKQELVFPAVASENRIPTITNLVLGVMIIGVVYGVWNFNKEANNSFHEMVATLSNHFSFKKQGSDKISSGKSNDGKVCKTSSPTFLSLLDTFKLIASSNLISVFEFSGFSEIISFLKISMFPLSLSIKTLISLS